MKLASFRDGTTATWGLVQAAGVQLAAPALRKKFPALRDLLADGALPDVLPQLAAVPLRTADALRFAPCRAVSRAAPFVSRRRGP